VAAEILGTRVATAVAIEAGHRIGAARFELASKDISIGHGSSIAQVTVVIGGRPPATRPPGYSTTQSPGHPGNQL
jgi:hypothetical protein